MSLIYNRVLEMDILWTRWGAQGEDGMHQKTPLPSREAAVTEFEKIFRSKTGNVWATRNIDFESKPGKFNMIQTSPYKKGTILTELDTPISSIPSQLSTGVQDCLRLCLDFKHLKSAQTDSKIDLPLGQLSQEILEKAYYILKEIDSILVELDVESVALVGVHNVARMKGSMTGKRSHKSSNSILTSFILVLNHKLGLLSNDYYLLVPNTSHSTRGIVPLRNRQSLNAELSRLDNLRYFNYTANVLLAAQHRSDQIHPLDYVYKSLNCHMQELTPENGHQVTYDMVAKYMQDTGAGPTGDNYDLLHLFQLERESEAVRYQPFAAIDNRMLLWHGSKISNLIGILKQGLRIKPAQAYESVSVFGTAFFVCAQVTD
jgi:Poly(ADP-ribose) polymerase, regulatory domain/Poly(ADP-ribose) polymerase catalytic domain/WGR domain